MSYYCESCGKKLPPDAKFCEFCGCKVEQENISAEHSDIGWMFGYNDWETRWKEKLKGDRNIGLILTNTTECPDDLLGHFIDKLNQYVAYCSQNRNIDYYILDLKNQCVTKSKSEIDCTYAVNIVKAVYAIGVPRYLFIVGDWLAVPNIKWDIPKTLCQNKSDKFVYSDFPYIALNTESPYSGFRYKLNESIPVGRLPAYANNGFDEAIIYFDKVINKSQVSTPLSAFTLTNIEWQITSLKIYSQLKPKFVGTPPPTSGDSIIINNSIDFENNPSTGDNTLLTFNLHGARQDNYWYSDYGIAFCSKWLPNNISYYLVSEACYGAKPVVGTSNNDSILCQALKGGALAFVGSTMIAYGDPSGDGSAADIIAKYFAKYVQDGYSCGDSFKIALINLLDKSKCIDEIVIKTLAEFALYGDPALSSSSSNTCADLTNCNKTNAHVNLNRPKCSFMNIGKKQNDERSINIAMPDIRYAVYAKLANVNDKISKCVKSYIDSNFSKFSDVEHEFYFDKIRNSYIASYSKSDESGKFLQHLLSYFDSNGKSIITYISK